MVPRAADTSLPHFPWDDKTWAARLASRKRAAQLCGSARVSDISSRLAEILSNAVETKDLFKGRTRKGTDDTKKRVFSTPGKGFGHSGEKVHVTVHITKEEWCVRPLSGARFSP